MAHYGLVAKLPAFALAAATLTGCVSNQNVAAPSVGMNPVSASIPANLLRKTMPDRNAVYTLNQADGSDFICRGDGTQGRMIDTARGVYVYWSADASGNNMGFQVAIGSNSQSAVIIENYKKDAVAYVLEPDDSLSLFSGNDSKEMQGYLMQLKHECDYAVVVAKQNGIGVGEEVTLSGEFNGIVIRGEAKGTFLSEKNELLSTAAGLPIVTRPPVNAANYGSRSEVPRYTPGSTYGGGF